MWIRYRVQLFWQFFFGEPTLRLGDSPHLLTPMRQTEAWKQHVFPHVVADGSQIVVVDRGSDASFTNDHSPSRAELHRGTNGRAPFVHREGEGHNRHRSAVFYGRSSGRTVRLLVTWQRRNHLRWRLVWCMIHQRCGLNHGKVISVEMPMRWYISSVVGSSIVHYHFILPVWTRPVQSFWTG